MGNKEGRKEPSVGYNFHYLKPLYQNAQINTKPRVSNLKVPDENAICYLLEDVLTNEECKYYIEQSELLGYETLNKEYPKEYRDNDRVLVKSFDLAEQLYNKVFKSNVQFFDDLRRSEIKPFGFKNEGIWVPTNLNEVIKFAKYQPGAKFRPHMDNCVAKGPDDRSIFTVIIYLNNDFEGGGTKFHQRPKGELPFIDDSTQDSTSSSNIKPEAGSVLLFNHDVLHEGLQVIKGTKYIMKCELMFKRVTTSGSILCESDLSSFLKSSVLYSNAHHLEVNGDLYSSTMEYLEALNIQVNHSSSIDSHSYPEDNIMSLPSEVILIIMSFASIDVLLNCSKVNRKLNYYSCESSIWRKLYLQDFGLLPDHITNKNWYSNYRDRHRASKNQGVPIVVLGTFYSSIGWSHCLEPLRKIESVSVNFDHPHFFDAATFAVGEKAYDSNVPGIYIQSHGVIRARKELTFWSNEYYRPHLHLVALDHELTGNVHKAYHQSEIKISFS
ncbi:prolyl 4-hydroxylase [Acrasis kona]|uniref:Prolyl 4-hydroxylase n=1 Tax=Acrasis kona TaxID=1008807 RepID=A0AAW2ZM90_9EUKA